VLDEGGVDAARELYSSAEVVPMRSVAS